MEQKVLDLKGLIYEARKKEGMEKKLNENLNFIYQERVKLVGNRLKNLLGMSSCEVEKEKIIESVKNINKISEYLGCKFRINETWNEIEAFLCFTILDDLSNEFKNQTM